MYLFSPQTPLRLVGDKIHLQNKYKNGFEVKQHKNIFFQFLPLQLSPIVSAGSLCKTTCQGLFPYWHLCLQGIQVSCVSLNRSKGRKKNVFGSTPRKISNQIFLGYFRPVSACYFILWLLLKYGLNDMINEKIKSSQFQQHWVLSCCAIYLKSSMDFHHPLCFSGSLL